MRTLREVRREHPAFLPGFASTSPHFWPIARAAAPFAERSEWPEVEDYRLAFRDGEGPVSFVRARPRSRRGPRIREELYDARIVTERVVPSRPRMWHDFLNALVWGTFPRAKLALHTWQHEAIQAWIPPGATRLPNARTRELDALALTDEGGVLELCSGTWRKTLIFGHALYEGLVLENRAMLARAIPLAIPEPLGDDPEVLCHAADARLAEALEARSDALRLPEGTPITIAR